MTEDYLLWDNVTIFDAGSGGNATTDANEEYVDTTNYCPYIDASPILHVVLATLYAIVCVIGVFGNSLVIFVVIRFR
jgi:hypothetical protein